MALGLNWWQQILLWPGTTFMDWFARNFPYLVIRHDFGFTIESYIYWSVVFSAGFWALSIIVLGIVLRRSLTPTWRRHGR